MELYVRKNHATFRVPAGAKPYLKRSLNKNHDLVARGNVVGEVWARGRGWYRLTAQNLATAVSALKAVMVRFVKERNAEIRSLLIRATSSVKTIAAVTVGDFVQFINYPQAVPRKKITVDKAFVNSGQAITSSLRRLAEAWQTRCVARFVQPRLAN